MTAGRGIVHSERTGPELRKAGSQLHGLQLWVALPQAQEETEPDFRHYPAAGLPEIRQGAARVRVLAGTAYGAASPVRTLSPLLYVEAMVPAGAELPLPEEHPERAAYVVEGAMRCGEALIEPRRMAVFAPGPTPPLRAESAARVALIGGAPLDGERHIWWNFVSSSRERIERAKRDWGRILRAVPGKEHPSGVTRGRCGQAAAAPCHIHPRCNGR
jgi:redox-sensitive bicupin YhaK (pirin superfamily)